MMQTRLLFRRKELVVLMCCLVMLMVFTNLPGANAANKSAKTFDQGRMNDLKKELQRIDAIRKEVKKDHPDDSRPPIEIVKSDIQFEEGFAKTLSDLKSKAQFAVNAFKFGGSLTVKAANDKLKPYFRADEKGNIYFLPVFTGIPYQFPTLAVTPNQAINLINDLAVKNNAQLDKRKRQLSLLEQEQSLRDELRSLERKAKTVADLWIYDPHLEDTGRKNTYKAVVGTTLRFKIMVRYNDDTDETLTHDPAKGIYLYPCVLTVDSAMEYNVNVFFSNGQTYPFTVEGYYPEKDFISFVTRYYLAREGRDEIITIELQREGKGRGKVTARFREILGKGTSAGDYAVIDPFPTWEDGEVGKKPIRVKIYDNKDSSYNKVITLQLEPTSGADVKYPKSTQITIEDDDMGGRLRFMAPRYNVGETGKKARIGIERVGERVLNRVTVRIQTLNGSAKDGEDYNAFSDTLTWGPSDKDIKHVEIPIIEDNVEEDTETFRVILSDPTGGAVLSTPNTTEITIRDVKDRQDGIQKARFSSSEYRVGEGGASIRITVHREGGTQGEFKVDYLTQDAYAQAGKDYVTSRGTLTWKDGDDRPQDFMVKIIDDQEPEPRPETVHLQLENPRNLEASVGFDATGTEAVIYIEDNDSETEEQKPPPVQRVKRCKYLKVTPQKAVARTTIPDTITFSAFAVFDDGSQQDVTNDPQTIWKPGPNNTYTPQREQLFTESVKIEADWQGCKGTAEVTALTGPISRADEVDREAPPPPTDAYKWYALCNKKTGEVTYGKDPDPMKHFIMGGPFPGPRTVRQWIDQNCSNWRCTSDGLCATAPALAPTGVEGWYVLCVKRTGAVTIGKKPGPNKHKVMAGPFLGEPDARNWIGTNCPNWRCTSEGLCATGLARGGEWYVLCSKAHGGVQLGKNPDSTKFWIMAGPFLGEPDARRWVDTSCPSWRCDRDGRCLTGIGRERDGRPLEVPSDIIAMFGQRGRDEDEDVRPTVSSADLYDRYTQGQQQRTEEVTRRHEADVERSYSGYGGKHDDGDSHEQMLQNLQQMQQWAQGGDRRRDTSGVGSRVKPPQQDEQPPPSAQRSDSEHAHYYLVEVVVETEDSNERCIETVRFAEQATSREEEERRVKEAFRPTGGKVKKIVSIKIDGPYDSKPSITPPPPPKCTAIVSTIGGSQGATGTQSQGTGYIAYYVVPKASWALEKTYVYDKKRFDEDTRKKVVLGTGATRKDAIRKACSKLRNIRSWRQSACDKVANYGDNTICIDGLDGCKN